MSHRSIRYGRGCAWRLLSKFALALNIALICLAQVDRSSLNGTVHDVSGRIVRGATVQATQIDTGLERSTVTGNRGTYTIENLPIGKYTITFSKPGFGEIRYQQVEQGVGQFQVAVRVLF